VSLSARLAVESPWITTDVINIAVLPYLAVRYGVDDIPTTVVNGRKACVGALPEDDFVRAVLKAAASTDTPSPA
jgi:Thioredoxin domain